MKFSEQWMRKWVNPSVSAQEMAEQLTMAGLEVDGVEPVAAEFSGILIGEVLGVEPHPDADKLRVCRVNAGDGGEPLTIVCGAPNVAAGMRVPLAKVGAVLPGLKIKASKLRGVKSFGMLCSAKELGLAETSEGLLALPADAPIGEDIRAYLQLDDVAIDVDLTPNRGDCLSILGIARELGTLNRCDLTRPEMAAISATIDDTFPIRLEAGERCPHYAGRVIRDVNPAAPTPLWMKEHLRRSGLRSISAIVDITNYVLLELGQPMHAFDLNKLQDGIVVREAVAGEKLTLLDDQEITLDADTLVIADAQGPQALAGIMGGAASAVGDDTRDIFLESAFFTPEKLAGCARRYGLQTDSSYRFERGVDPSLQVLAIERATALLQGICGGEVGPVSEVSSESHQVAKAPVTLRSARITRLLGQDFAASEVEDILTRLGIHMENQSEGVWQAVPPAFRFDINIEADLIEELARVHGYNQLPSTHAHTGLRIQPQTDRGMDDLRAVLVQRGYQEAITYSFVDAKLQAQLLPELTAIPLANPLASDMAVMRTGLWPGLLQAAQHNLKRQQASVRLFENGLRFVQQGDNMQQDAMLAGLLCGPLVPEQWGEAARDVDFYDAKADVEALLQLANLEPVRFQAANHPALHPGQCAEIMRDGRRIGWLGALHPALAHHFDMTKPLFLFELELDALLIGRLPQFQALSRFPSTRRDIALIVDEAVQAAELLDAVRAQAGEFLVNLQLFDIYRGKGIDSGKKSLALGLTFRASSRNLTESEVDATMSALLEALETGFKAVLRD